MKILLISFQTWRQTFFFGRFVYLNKMILSQILFDFRKLFAIKMSKLQSIRIVDCFY